MTEKLITMKWDLSILNKMIGMVFKQNAFIVPSNLRNIQTLIHQSDFTVYQSKNIIMKRIAFLEKALQGRLDDNIVDEGLLLTYCRTDDEDPTVNDIISNLSKYKQLNHSEIEFINTYVEDRLKYGVVQSYIDDLTNIIEKVNDGEFSTYAQANATLESWISNYMIATRQFSSSYNNSVLDLNDPNIRDRVDDVLKKLGGTQSVIITGMRMLNELLSPGFRPGKLYMFLGLTGGFKSALLLKVVIDCVRYNARSYRPKKEGYKPVVLYLTMENTKEESLARMYNMAVSTDDMGNHNSKEIVNKFTELELMDNKDMGIIIMYRANMSIDTNDLRNILEELDSQGKEVVLLSFDYIKRIRPQERALDEKAQLKNVTNELRTIAIDYDIPVVSAHQMNRTGLSIINNALREEKADMARLLGGDNVGSAYEVMENADMSIILNLERRRTDNKLFLTCYRIKTRYKPDSKLDYFNQPFVEGNDFMLEDDIFEPTPKGIISLATDLEGVDPDMLYNTNKGRKNHMSPTLAAPVHKTEDLFSVVPMG